MPAPARLRAAAALAAVTAAAVAAPAGATTGTRFQEAVTGPLGVVATEDEHASRAAVAVLEAGGNAVDAAIAATLTIGVTRPEMCGIGGGGFLIARSPQGAVRALDFREMSPSEYTYVPGMTLPGTQASRFGTGHGVVGVPGTVAGLAEAHRVLGSGDPDAAWSHLVQPAIRAARDGFVMSPVTREPVLDYRAVDVAFFPASVRTLVPAALRSLAGQPTAFPEYAATLERIAQDPRDFYEGEAARTLIAEMQRLSPYVMSGDRSTMTAADLAAYRPMWREPVSTTYRGHQVHGVPAPTSGGTAVVEMLNMIETHDLTAYGPGSANTLHVLAEAQKIAWADRAAYLGDPAFVTVPEALTSKGYGRQRAQEIDLARAQESYPALGGARQPKQSAEGQHTTHLSVLDAAGGAAAVTCTIEQPLGSAVVVEGGGYLLNNQLTDFTADDPTSPNRPEPGKRPRSSTSPMLVVKGGDVVLAVGGQGGPTIIMGVLQAIVGVVDFGLDPARALDAARVDARGFFKADGFGARSLRGNELNIEDARLDPAVLDELSRRGHLLERAGEYAFLPGLNAVGVDRSRGLNSAAGDPRQPRAPMAQTR